MGMIIPCIMHTKPWVHIMHGSALYTAKYSKWPGSLSSLRNFDLLTGLFFSPHVCCFCSKHEDYDRSCSEKPLGKEVNPPTRVLSQDTPKTSPWASRVEFNYEGFYVAFFFSGARNISCVYWSVKTREKIVLPQRGKRTQCLTHKYLLNKYLVNEWMKLIQSETDLEKNKTKPLKCCYWLVIGLVVIFIFSQSSRVCIVVIRLL